MNELIAGTIAAPKDLPADAVGSVGTPNTLPADNAGIVGTPNTVPTDGAGIIAAPISLPSQGAAALPRSLTPMVDFDFAAKRYVQDGVAVAFEDIFNYTRASSATFTNRRLKKNGGYEYFLDNDYVGSVTNLATYSEDFTNSDWTKNSVTVTGNALIAPDGTLTADKLLDSATLTGHYVEQSLAVSASAKIVHTVYAKKAERDFLALYDNSAGKGQYFNLSAGVIGGILSGAPDEVSMSYEGNGWYKCSIAVTVPASTSTPRAYTVKADGAFSYTGDGVSGIYIFGYQSTESAKPLPYVKTLDVAVTKAFAETLRTEYDPVTGNNLGALIEGGSTNLAFWSEEFSPNWSRTDSTVVLNQTTAPDNTVSADLIYPNASGANKQVYRAVTGVPITTYTSSFYVKSAGMSWVMLPAASASNGVWFDLINGVIGTETAGTSGSMLNIGNGWFRCSVTSDATTTVAYSHLRMVDSDGVTTVTANGTSGLYVWGAQLEELPFATSYIRTEGAAVSRSSDNLSVDATTALPIDLNKVTVALSHSCNGINNVSNYLWRVTNSPTLFSIHNDVSSSVFRINYNGVAIDSSAQLDINKTYNSAMVYNSNTIEGYLSGVSYASSSVSVETDSLIGTSMNIGRTNTNTSGYLFGHISKLSTYAQALTAQEITLL